MTDYINTIDSLKEVSDMGNFGLTLLAFFAMIPLTKLSNIGSSSEAKENKKALIAFIGALIGFVVAGYIMLVNAYKRYAYFDYVDKYQYGLYNHYSEYKDNIKSVSIPKDNRYKFNLVVNVDNTDYTIALDRFDNTYEEVDTPDSEESYYELFRDTDNQKVGIRKYIGSLELDERHGERTSNTFKETK